MNKGDIMIAAIMKSATYEEAVNKILRSVEQVGPRLTASERTLCLEIAKLKFIMEGEIDEN